MAIALVKHQASGFTFEFGSKGTALLGHRTPIYGEHSRLNGCPESSDHYIISRRIYQPELLCTLAERSAPPLPQRPLSGPEPSWPK